MEVCVGLVDGFLVPHQRRPPDSRAAVALAEAIGGTMKE
jgi:hypothetical protein